MTTKKRRQKFAFPDETMKKLEWLVQEHKKEVKNESILVILFLK